MKLKGYHFIISFLLASSIYMEAQVSTLRIVQFNVRDVETEKMLSDVRINIVSSGGLDTSITTDRSGATSFLFDKTLHYLIHFSKVPYIGEKMDVSSFDTLKEANVYLRYSGCGPTLPVYYFVKNISEPIDKSKTSLAQICKDNPKLIFNIIGFNDPEEDSMISWHRAERINRLFIDEGVDSSRLFCMASQETIPKFNRREHLKFEDRSYLIPEGTSFTLQDISDMEPDKKAAIYQYMRRVIVTVRASK